MDLRVSWNPAGGIRGVDRDSVRRLFLTALRETPCQALRKELLDAGEAPGSVTVRLADDREVGEMNARFLSKVGPTDVLSFPLFEADPESNRLHWGDIVISRETAHRVAAELELPATEEMLRYVLHGFLHLIGYDDRDAARRRRMLSVQEHLLRESRLNEAPGG